MQAGQPYVVVHMAKRHPIVRAITELQYPLLTLRGQAYSCRRVEFCDALSMRKIHDHEEGFDKEGWSKALRGQARLHTNAIDDYVSADPLYHQMLRAALAANTTVCVDARGICARACSNWGPLLRHRMWPRCAGRVYRA